MLYLAWILPPNVEAVLLQWTLWYGVIHTKSSPLCLMKTALNKDTVGAIIAQSDGWAVGWNVKLPRPPPRFKKVLSLAGGHAVIEVFTTRQKCDGTENVGDSDAWLNRLLCTDCRAALWIVMPHFIVLRLKGSPLGELHYSTPCSFWYSGPQNKDHVSKARRTPADSLVELKMLCDSVLTETDRQKVSPPSRCLSVHDKTVSASQHSLFCRTTKRLLSEYSQWREVHSPAQEPVLKSADTA